MSAGAIAFAAYLLALLVCTVRWPAIALVGILCMFSLELWGQVNFSFLVAHQSITNLALGLLVAMALGLMAMKRQLKRPIGGTAHLCVIMLFFYAFVSTLWTPVPDQAHDLWRTQAPYLMVFLIFVPMLVQTEKDIRIGLVGFLIFGSVLAVALVVFVDWGYRGLVANSSGDYERGFGNPLALAQLGGYVAIVAMLMRFESKSYVFLKWAVIGVSLLLLARADSRGQFFAAIFCCAAFYPMSRGYVNLKGYIAGLLLSVTLVGAGYFGYQKLAPDLVDQGLLVERSFDRWNVDVLEATYGARIENAARLLDRTYDSLPSILFGLGNSASYDPRIIGGYPHIVALEILGEEGLIGFALFLGVLIAGARSIGRLRGHAGEHPAQRCIIAILGALFLFELILSFKQGAMIGSASLFLFPILLERFATIMAERDSVSIDDESEVKITAQRRYAS